MSDAAVDGRTPAAPGRTPPGPQAPGQGDPRRAPGPGRAWGLIRRHRLFAAVLAGAAVLRAVVMLGYPPAMWFNDSYSYVYDAIHTFTATNHPSGYSAFLLILLPSC